MIITRFVKFANKLFSHFLFHTMLGTYICNHVLQFLKDTIFLKGIEVYEHIIHALSSFEEAN